MPSGPKSGAKVVLDSLGLLPNVHYHVVVMVRAGLLINLGPRVMLCYVHVLRASDFTWVPTGPAKKKIGQDGKNLAP